MRLRLVYPVIASLGVLGHDVGDTPARSLTGRRGHTALGGLPPTSRLSPTFDRVHLGGWFAGALLALTTTARRPARRRAAGGCIGGLPVGLGSYLAWVNRDRPTNSKLVTMAAPLVAPHRRVAYGYTTQILYTVSTRE